MIKILPDLVASRRGAISNDIEAWDELDDFESRTVPATPKKIAQTNAK